MRWQPLLIVLVFLAVIILGVQVVAPLERVMALNATVVVQPNTLNLHMNGQFITVFIGLPTGYNVSDIDRSTILLDGLFKPVFSVVNDSTLMVKFDASAVTDFLLLQLYHMGVSKASVELTVTGQLNDGTVFSGSDTIIVMNPPLGS